MKVTVAVLGMVIGSFFVVSTLAGLPQDLAEMAAMDSASAAGHAMGIWVHVLLSIGVVIKCGLFLGSREKF